MRVCARHWRNVDVDRIAERHPDAVIPEWLGKKVGSVSAAATSRTHELERLESLALYFDGDCNYEINPKVVVEIETCFCGAPMVEVTS